MSYAKVDCSHLNPDAKRLRVCGVVPWLDIVRNIILLHTHTHTHHTSSTPHQQTTYLFTPHHFTPDPFWKTSSSSEAIDKIKRLDAWPLDVGRSGCRCDTPGSSWKPPSSSYDIAGCPCFFAVAFPNQFKYLVWGQEPGCLTHAHRRLLTEERLFSLAYYYTVGTSCNAVQCHIISVVLWLDYLQTSLFISIYHTSHL
jgi:hypothetical protein